MEGTIFFLILLDLQREGMDEMPWDSTGQEEVYMWSRYFGYMEKADVTLNAILAYMPTLPHWGYNGSARRYWDFLFAGKLQRIERQLHHYGSGLNAIPVLKEYRNNPEDLYLLRGHGGLMGSVSNITRTGFDPAGAYTPKARLRMSQPAQVEGVSSFRIPQDFNKERGAWVIPLGEGSMNILLRQQ